MVHVVQVEVKKWMFKTMVQRLMVVVKGHAKPFHLSQLHGEGLTTET